MDPTYEHLMVYRPNSVVLPNNLTSFLLTDKHDWIKTRGELTIRSQNLIYYLGQAGELE